MSSEASRICGIAFGLTKDAASMRFRPVAARRSTNSTFCAVSSSRSSFCRPSRGPTSVIATALGSCMMPGLTTLQLDQHVALCHLLARAAGDPRDHAVDARLQNMLHLHRL